MQGPVCRIIGKIKEKGSLGLFEEFECLAGESVCVVIIRIIFPFPFPVLIIQLKIGRGKVVDGSFNRSIIIIKPTIMWLVGLVGM